MSIFDFFRSKPKPKPSIDLTVQIGDKEEKIHITPENCVPPTEQEQKAQEAERQQAQNDRDAFTIRHAILCLGELAESYHPWEHDIQPLQNVRDELIELCKDKERYSELVHHTLQTLSEEGYEADELQKNFATDPGKADIASMAGLYTKETMMNYRPYWEDTISKLKQKAAIRKRRQYLIEHIDEMIPVAVAYGFADVVEELTDYRNENEAKIADQV